MSRNLSGIYSLPAGSIVSTGDTILPTQHNTPLNDIASDLNLPRPVVAGGTGADNAAGALVNLGLTATAAQLNSVQQFAGRNLIINGSGRINQRGYVSGAATSGANQFTLDRWFVVTSGQNLAFTGDASRRVMTAPAGGVRQVVEGANVVGGSYVLNWTGTATATVNGVARTKGEVFTLPENTNVVVAFVGGTFTDVQIERGSLVTPFEWRSIGQELALCQRYFFSTSAVIPLQGFGDSSGLNVNATLLFPVTMRGIPTATNTFSSGVNNTAQTIINVNTTGFTIRLTSASAGNYAVVYNAGNSFSAELTS